MVTWSKLKSVNAPLPLTQTLAQWSEMSYRTLCKKEHEERLRVHTNVHKCSNARLQAGDQAGVLPGAGAGASGGAAGGVPPGEA